MMGVPPPSQPPSTPPSGGGRSEGPDRGKKKGREKEFKLPEKKEKKEEEQQKGYFGIESQSAQQKVSSEKAAQEMEIGKTSEIEAKQETAKLSKVSELIQNMASDLKVGTLQGRDFASMNLKATSDIPAALAGSSLTVSFTENGLSIRFSNFMTPQQEQAALNLIDQNREQLTQLVQNLQAKNIQLAELNVGNNTIRIPTVEQPTPIQPIAPGAEAKPGEERREGGGEEKEREEGGREG